MSDNQEEISKLTKTRNIMLLGAVLVAISTGLKVAGLFSVGFIPPWASGLLVLLLIGSAIQTHLKISKVE